MRYIDMFMAIVINVSIVTSVSAEKYEVLRIAPRNAEIKVAGISVRPGDVFDSGDKIVWDEHEDYQGMIVCLSTNQNVRYSLTKDRCKQHNAQNQSLDFLVKNNIISMGKASVRDFQLVDISGGEDEKSKESELNMRHGISFEGNQSLQNYYLACQNAYNGVEDANLSQLKEAYKYFMSSAAIMLLATAVDSTMLLSTKDRFVYSAEYIQSLYQNVDIGSIERGEEVDRVCHVLHGALAANGSVIYHIPNAQQISRICVWIEPTVDAAVSMQVVSPDIYQARQYDWDNAVCVLECTPNNKDLKVQIKISGSEPASFVLLTD